MVDFETALDGVGSTAHWHPRFEVVSMAASWLGPDGAIVSEFILGEPACLAFLEHIAAHKIPAIAHNIQFEMGVTQCRFPKVAGQILWHADTMRLTQVYDNGGDKFAMEAPLTYDEILERATDDGTIEVSEKPESTAGLGLGKAIRRILREPDHKRPTHQWLRDNIGECRSGREGQFLNRLPPDMLRAYNIADTEATLRLYKFLVEFFASVGYDWRLDHQLYFSSVRHLVNAKIRGTRINREALEAYGRAVKNEIDVIARQFRERFAREIAVVERARLLAEIQGRKTLRGRRNYLRKIHAGNVRCRADITFNVGSNKQLEALFCGVLGIRAQFQTAKGAPSFRSAVLHQFGDGGLMLQKRRKRLLVLKQVEALLELSAFDGRWHMDLRGAGTSTGRFSGGQHA